MCSGIIDASVRRRKDSVIEEAINFTSCSSRADGRFAASQCMRSNDWTGTVDPLFNEVRESGKISGTTSRRPLQGSDALNFLITRTGKGCVS